MYETHFLLGLFFTSVSQTFGVLNVTITKPRLEKLLEIYETSGKKFGFYSNVFFVTKVPDVIEELMRVVHVNDKGIVLDPSRNCTTATFLNDYNSHVGKINYMFILLDPKDYQKELPKILSCYKQAISSQYPKIIATLLSPTEKQLVENIFRYFWQEKILNVVIIDQNSNILSYNPYFNSFYRKMSKQPFPDKFRNMNGHTINAFLTRPEDFTKVRGYKTENGVRYTGKDGETIGAILQHCNATLNVIDLDRLYGVDNPWRMVNKYRKEHMKMPIVKEFQADLFIESRDLLYDLASDIVYPHTKDGAVIIVPKAGFLSGYEQLVEIFQNGFAYFILFFVVICPIVWILLVHLEQKLHRTIRVNYLQIVFDNFRIFLGLATDTFRGSFIYKFLLIWVLFCSLILNNYFQSILITIMTVSNRQSDIDTIEDLADSDLQTQAPLYFINEIKKNLLSTGYTKIPKFVIMPDQIYLTKLNNYPKNTTSMMNFDRAEVIVFFCPVLHVMKEEIMPSLASFHTTKGSPYFSLLEKYVPRIIEAGLYNFWKNQNNHQLLLNLGYCDAKNEEDDGKYQILTVKKLQFSFVLLLIGWGTSLACFIAELISALGKNYFNRNKLCIHK